MEQHVPEAVLAELAAARAKPKGRKHRLRVKADERVFPVLKVWRGGFSVPAEDTPKLRGFVDLFDGGRHLASCLVMASHEETGVMHYEYKRVTRAQMQGAVDFEIDTQAPAGLLTQISG